MALEASDKHVDLVVTPEAYFRDPVMARREYAAHASQLQLAVVGAFLSATNTSAGIWDRTGHQVLEYTKPHGTPAEPTAGGNRTVVELNIAGGCAVKVAILLGTDFLFPETTRALMPQGVELVLSPLSQEVTDTDLKHLHITAIDNKVFLATANYGGSGFNGRSGLAWAGSKTRPLGGEELAGSDVGLFAFDAPISALEHVGGGDTHREPFRYRHLCYDSERQRDTQRGTERQRATEEDRERQKDATASHASIDANGQGVTNDQIVTVGMLQMAPAVLADNSVELNAQKAATYARQAKASGADIVVMPEQWLVGYTATFPGFGSEAPEKLSTEDVFRYTDQAISVDGPTMSAFKSLARELDMAIAVSHLQDLREPAAGGGLGGRPPHNSVTLIDRFGDVAYSYNKVHTCYWVVDEALTTPGHAFFAASISIRPGLNVTVGSFICYDRSFPEAARSVMMAGAELFLAPTACTISPIDHDIMSVRSRENAAAAVLVNFAANESTAVPPAHLNSANGNSVGTDHEGNVVAVGQTAGNTAVEGVFLARFDIGQLRAYRSLARGQALTHPRRHPEICQLFKPNGTAADTGPWGRMTAPF